LHQNSTVLARILDGRARALDAQAGGNDLAVGAVDLEGDGVGDLLRLVQGTAEL
jgi:hypothetical protein